MRSHKYFIFAILLTSYLIALAFFAPGLHDNVDNADQFSQGLGLTKLEYWQPLVHTVLIGIFSRPFLNLTGFVVFQIIVFAIVITWSILKIFEYHIISKKQSYYLAIFYGLFPTFFIGSVSTQKDNLFAIVLLLLTIDLFLIFKTKGKIIDSRAFFVQFIIMTYFLAELRKNALFVIAIVLMILIIIYKKYLFRLMQIAVLSVILILLTSFWMFLNPSESSGISQLFPIAFNQIGSVYAKNEVKENYQIIEKIHTKNQWRENYHPQNADTLIFNTDQNGDMIKLDNFDAKDVPQFLVEWLNLGSKHPIQYIKAYFDLESNLYFPDYKNMVGNTGYINYQELNMIPDIKKNDFPCDYISNSRCQKIIDNFSHLMSNSLFPNIANFYLNFYKQPLINSLIFENLFISFWLILSLFIYSLKKRFEKRFLIILSPVGLYLFTLLFSTPIVIFRYVFPLLMCLPILFLVVKSHQSSLVFPQRD